MSPKRHTSFGKILAIRSERRRTFLFCTLAACVFMAVQAMPVTTAAPKPVSYDVSIEVGQKSKIAVESAGTGKLAAPGKVGRKAARKANTHFRAEGSAAPQASALVLSTEASVETAVSGEAETMPEATEVVGVGEAGGQVESIAGGGGGGGAAGGEAKTELEIGKPRPRSWMWNCNWPLFASARDATVNVRVTVNKKGQAERVEVVSATHREFVSDAHECALNGRYHPAKNSLGEVVDAVSDVWPIHFIRSESGTY